MACNGNQCNVPRASGFPVRYATGEIILRVSDILTGGYASGWGHTRSFLNRLKHPQGVGQGYNWQVEQWPYLIANLDGQVSILGKADSAYWFVKTETGYDSMFRDQYRLELSQADGVYRLFDPNGTITEFDDYTGMFTRQVSPGGDVVSVTAMAPNGYNVTSVEQTVTVAGVVTVEQFNYEYITPYADTLLQRVTLRRQVDGGAWQNVARASYTYYGPSEANGGLQDLKTVVTEIWDGSAWSETGTTYYRYYPEFASASSSSSSGGPSAGWDVRAHLLKYVLNPSSYARMVSDDYNPLTASDAGLALYADNYFEYDEQRRVTKELVDGASRTFLFNYVESVFDDGVKSWKTRTAETLPDGTQNIVYSNYAGQTMLFVRKSGSDEWCTFYEYDSDFRVILQAEPSAVTGYDDAYADLLNYNSGTGKYQYLRDNAGLVRIYGYHAPSGFLADSSIQEGQLGTPIKLREYEYCCCGQDCGCSGTSSSSSSSSGGCESGVWFLLKETVYPSDSNQTLTNITESCYSFYAGTTQVQQKTTTLPVVPTDQNGSGVAATRKEYYDPYGNLTWSMDERGFITRMAYDIPTGAMIQQVADADTSLYSDAPAGWTTPSGGGLNLVTDITVDSQGRMTQSLGPSHSIDLNGTATTIRRATWLAYDDANHITYSGQGYATGTSPSYSYTLVNPVSITKMDAGGKVLEQIQATASSTSGTLASIISAAGGGAAAFPQTSYTRWTTNQYTDCCLAASTRVYHTIPASGEGSSGTNYDETDYGYDVMKRRNRMVTPGGTITYQVFDARGLVSSTWIGTNDNGATDQDPSGGGASGNNMVLVTGNVYDGGAAGGDGNLTQQTQYAAASDARVTSFTYDFRDRRVTTDGEVDDFQKLYYDNLDRVVKSERYDTTSGGNLIARSETKFDPRGQVYQTIRYGVDPGTGTVGNSLTDNTWFSPTGQKLKVLPAGSDLFTKAVYDSLGRMTTRYVGYDTAETSYSDAGSVTDDVIMEQSETSYDAARNVLQTTSRQRYHNAPASQLGALGDPSTTPKARVTYAAQWPDALGRTVAAADYGTNGGSALSRPGTIPSRSDTVLVTSTVYDAAGNPQSTTDPAGMVTCVEYDDRGRETAKILNPTSSSSSSSSSSGGCSPSDDENVTVQTAYNADGNVSSITAVNASTGNQVTQYVYGSTLSDSDIACSLLKVAEIYPDSVSGSDQITFAYNRQQQVTQVTDQGGTVHAYDYDKLGRQTQDRITTLGSGVDGAVRRIATTYEVRGMKAKLTSYDNPTVGSGTVVNAVQFAYNDFGQLTTDYQSHSGAVNVSTTPKVQYGYASGAANTIRPTMLTYPNGRVLTFSYGAGSISDRSSRIASIIDDDSTHLVDYDYLGRGTFVVADDTQPDVKWTLVDLSGSNDPDTGDIYSGLDRFGRVKDTRWYDYGSSTDVDRIKYGYDRAGNRIWRENTVAASLSKEFDELYTYDGVHRLQDMQRGTLNSGHTALTSETFAQCWTLDATGNWSGFRQDDTGDGTWDLVQARTANTVNEITDITNSVGSAWVDPAYSAAGNVTTLPQPNDPTQSYTATYDAWNRLVKLAAGSNTVSEYAYDGAKRRVIQQTYSGGSLSETRHLYYTQPSQWQVVEERVGSSSNPQRQFVLGLRYIDDCVLRDRDTGGGTLDERLYACQDGNWNVDVIVDTAGDVQERYTYSAYGAPMFLTAGFGTRSASSYAWESLYCGYRFETATALVHIRHRFFVPAQATWGQRDPAVYLDSANLYEYCQSNPLNRCDAHGLAAADCQAAYSACFRRALKDAVKCFGGCLIGPDLLFLGGCSALCAVGCLFANVAYLPCLGACAAVCGLITTLIGILNAAACIDSFRVDLTICNQALTICNKINP